MRRVSDESFMCKGDESFECRGEGEVESDAGGAAARRLSPIPATPNTDAFVLPDMEPRTGETSGAARNLADEFTASGEAASSRTSPPPPPPLQLSASFPISPSSSALSPPAPESVTLSPNPAGDDSFTNDPFPFALSPRADDHQPLPTPPSSGGGASQLSHGDAGHIDLAAATAAPDAREAQDGLRSPLQDVVFELRALQQNLPPASTSSSASGAPAPALFVEGTSEGTAAVSESASPTLPAAEPQPPLALPRPPDLRDLSPASARRWSLQEMKDTFERMKVLIASREASAALEQEGGGEESFGLDRLDPDLRALLSPYDSGKGVPAALRQLQEVSPEKTPTSAASTTNLQQIQQQRTPPSSTPYRRTRRNTVDNSPSQAQLRDLYQRRPPTASTTSPTRRSTPTAELTPRSHTTRIPSSHLSSIPSPPPTTTSNYSMRTIPRPRTTRHSSDTGYFSPPSPPRAWSPPAASSTPVVSRQTRTLSRSTTASSSNPNAPHLPSALPTFPRRSESVLASPQKRSMHRERLPPRLNIRDLFGNGGSGVGGADDARSASRSSFVTGATPSESWFEDDDLFSARAAPTVSSPSTATAVSSRLGGGGGGVVEGDYSRMSRHALFHLLVDTRSELHSLQARYALEKVALEGALSRAREEREEARRAARRERAVAVALRSAFGRGDVGKEGEGVEVVVRELVGYVEELRGRVDEAEREVRALKGVGAEAAEGKKREERIRRLIESQRESERPTSRVSRSSSVAPAASSLSKRGGPIAPASGLPTSFSFPSRLSTASASAASLPLSESEPAFARPPSHGHSRQSSQASSSSFALPPLPPEADRLLTDTTAPGWYGSDGGFGFADETFLSAAARDEAVGRDEEGRWSVGLREADLRQLGEMYSSEEEHY